MQLRDCFDSGADSSRSGGLTAAIGAVAATNNVAGERAAQILLLIGAVKFTVEYPKRVHGRLQQRQTAARVPASAT